MIEETKPTRDAFAVDVAIGVSYLNYVHAFRFYDLSATYYQNRLLMVII